MVYSYGAGETDEARGKLPRRRTVTAVRLMNETRKAKPTVVRMVLRKQGEGENNGAVGLSRLRFRLQTAAEPCWSQGSASLNRW